jgi:hypothetical protein
MTVQGPSKTRVATSGGESNSRALNDKNRGTRLGIDHAAMLGWMLLTILTTALGLGTFVASQIVLKFFEPALDRRSFFGDIANARRENTHCGL